MTHWEEISRTRVFGKFTRRIDKVEYLLPDGSESDFYIKNEPDASAVVALTEDRKIITVRQFRPGPQRVLAELPGGLIDHNESPSDAAARELEEETGYRPQTIRSIGTYFVDAYSTAVRHCFLAEDCVLASPQQLDPTEFGEIALLTLEEFSTLVFSGQMTDTTAGHLALAILHSSPMP